MNKLPKSIGFIQTRGIGDIVIGLPIATHYADQGTRVIWPVDSRFCAYFRRAAPWIDFVEVPPEADGRTTIDYFYHAPRRILTAMGCEEIISLYSMLDVPGLEVVNRTYAQSLKFDEYKYAVSRVPFSEKWNLRIERDPGREIALYESLNLGGSDSPYICVHRQGHHHKFAYEFPSDWYSKYRVVEIDERSDSPFDWLYVLEGAEKLVLVDSCFANLVEQLGLQTEKYFLPRSVVEFTPVLRSYWRFVTLVSGPPQEPVERPCAWLVR